MIAYLISSLILLGILFILYTAFMENEKMHRFNRYFLLSCIGIGLTAPLISFEIETPNTVQVAGIEVYPSDLAVQKTGDYIVNGLADESFIKQLPTIEPIINQGTTTPSSSVTYIVFGILLIYLVGVIIQCIYFYSSIRSLLVKAYQKTALRYKGAEVVLIEEDLPPHSFLNYIFLNEKEYRSGNISEAILEHELVHIQQKHSLDILFIEAVKIVFWFNPLIYFYKRAIQLNHEFLADKEVAGNATTIKDYQDVLLTYMGAPQTEPIASTINFSLSKKRLLMMVKESSKWVMSTKLAVLLPLLGCFLFLYCADVQTIPSEPNSAETSLRLNRYTPAIAGARDTNVVYSNFDLFEEYKEIYMSLHRTMEDQLFTGTQIWYDGMHDYKRAEVIFEEGLLKSQAYFDSTGIEILRAEHEIDKDKYVKTKRYEKGIFIETNEVWFEDGNYVKSRSVRDGREIWRNEYEYENNRMVVYKRYEEEVLITHIYNEGGMALNREYHKNGILKSEFSVLRPEGAEKSLSYTNGKYHGIIAKYAEDGTVERKERWENGMLVETIK